MKLDVKTRIEHLPTLNSIKEKTSSAFLLGLNSTVNYSIDKAGSDYDGLGIDYRAASKTVGIGRKAVTPANEINIQLKGVSITSKSKLEITESHVRYKMDKRLDAVGRHYLFVVVLPDPLDLLEWCGIDETTLLLQAHGYYFEIENSLKAGFVDIPKTNKLNAETFMDLFDTEIPEFA